MINFSDIFMLLLCNNFPYLRDNTAYTPQYLTKNTWCVLAIHLHNYSILRPWTGYKLV